MIRNTPASRCPVPAVDGSLVRADLLRAAYRALEGARALAETAALRGKDERAGALLERLGAHREILARRAANVALAPIVSAEELHDLRDMARTLVAVRGLVARKLGLVGQMS